MSNRNAREYVMRHDQSLQQTRLANAFLIAPVAMHRQVASVFLGILLSLTSAGLTAAAPDGQEPYFPEGVLVPESAELDSFRNNWYSTHLRAMSEPILRPSPVSRTYRFTWLRTFHHPVTVRVVNAGDKVMLVATELSGAGGYEPGHVLRRKEVNLAAAQFADIEAFVQQQGFWNLPAHEKTFGLDGSEWIVEGATDKYHVVSRWSPESGSIRAIGEKVLAVAGWQFKADETY
ncbi:MAG: hypothetical protein ACREVE_08655 [Gammaproteobacteria bacterium]